MPVPAQATSTAAAERGGASLRRRGDEDSVDGLHARARRVRVADRLRVKPGAREAVRAAGVLRAPAPHGDPEGAAALDLVPAVVAAPLLLEIVADQIDARVFE